MAKRNRRWVRSAAAGEVAVQDEVVLREVVEGDLAAFFEHQSDPVACERGTFQPRTPEAFRAHWDKILADRAVDKLTVVYRGEVAGNLVAFDAHGKRLVGYWIGSRFWGRGVATGALRAFLARTGVRPLHAYVATQTVPSIRVLEKCGFAIDAAAGVSRGADGVEEVLRVLR